jgi:hypothetical protein
LLEAREEYRDPLDIQVVAFPQDGLARDPGALDYVKEAVAMGADVVGGIPWIEYTNEDATAHIDAMVGRAAANDRAVSMLVDDAGDPGLRTLEYLITAIEHASKIFLTPACVSASFRTTYPTRTTRSDATICSRSRFSRPISCG